MYFIAIADPIIISTSYPYTPVNLFQQGHDGKAPLPFWVPNIFGDIEERILLIEIIINRKPRLGRPIPKKYSFSSR